MSLKPQAIAPVPAETARIARAAYPKGNISMHMRDVLGSLYTDEDFMDLFPQDGHPLKRRGDWPWSPCSNLWRTCQIEPPADAVRGRLDWKYLLGLELTDAGFDASVLCEFRARLLKEHAEERLLEKMLVLFQQKGWRISSWATAHRFNPCPGQDSCFESSPVCLGSHERRSE